MRTRADNKRQRDATVTKEESKGEAEGGGRERVREATREGQ